MLSTFRRAGSRDASAVVMPEPADYDTQVYNRGRRLLVEMLRISLVALAQDRVERERSVVANLEQKVVAITGLTGMSPVLAFLASPERGSSTAQTIAVDGGMSFAG